ncbi:MAG: aldo/keto reductase [Anaerovoracaceae bacterium]
MLKVALGNTNLNVSQVGIGVLPMGPGQLALPVDEGADIICHAVRQGINFIDTAQYYRTYPYIRRALEILSLAGGESTHEAPGGLVICSKSLAHDYDGMKAAIEQALTELARPFMDIFLMHEVRTGDFEERKGAWQALIDARTAGLVKAIGVSTHHVDVTEQMASVPECDVVFSLINYASMGIRRGSEPGTCEEMLEAIRSCRNAGKGVFTMKVFGGGNLMGNYQKALDYVFSKEEIQSVMIGFGSKAEVDDIINYLNGGMPSDYNPDISHKKMRISQEDCEGCGSCIKACASKAIFYNKNGLAQIDQSRCLTCGYCSYACPVRAIIRF